jgi:hypothetical protein
VLARTPVLHAATPTHLVSPMSLSVMHSYVEFRQRRLVVGGSRAQTRLYVVGRMRNRRMKLFSPLGLPGAIAAGATLLAMLLAQPASAPDSGRWVLALSSGASSVSSPQADRAMGSLSLATDTQANPRRGTTPISNQSASVPRRRLNVSASSAQGLP